MTEELIRKHCKEHKLYQTPYLNDVLYLHYKGTCDRFYLKHAIIKKNSIFSFRILFYRESREIYRSQVSVAGEQRYTRDRQFGKSERTQVSVSAPQPYQQNRESRLSDKARHPESLAQHDTEDRESR